MSSFVLFVVSFDESHCPCQLNFELSQYALSKQVKWPHWSLIHLHLGNKQ